MKKRFGFETKMQMSQGLTQNIIGILIKKEIQNPKNLELKIKFFFKNN